MAMIQIRHVPDDIHRRLKAQAALEGTSLSEYLLHELRRIAERPTREELVARLPWGRRHVLDPAPAALLREERDAR